MSQLVTTAAETLQVPIDCGLLPDGWKLMRLRELCERITDGTHQPPPFVSKGIPFLFVRNIIAGRIDFNVSQYVTEETYEALTRRCRPTRNDILYSAVGSFGVAVVIDTDKPFTFQRHIAHLKLKRDLINPYFLAYYINSPQGRQQSELTALGGAQRTVTLTSLAKFEIPVPSLAEQERIVTRLSEQMETVWRARAAAEAQLKAAKELPGAYLRDVFESAEAQRWQRVRLEKVCTVHPGQHILEQDYNHKGIGIGYLTGPADFGDEYPSVTKWTEKPKAWCESGDALVTVKGAGVGKINLALEERLAIGRQLMAVRPMPDLIIQKFLFWVMKTHFELLQANALGATVPGLGRENIESLIVPLPSLSEQEKIVSLFIQKSQAWTRIQSDLQDQFDSINKLPAALLRQAFAGKL